MLLTLSTYIHRNHDDHGNDDYHCNYNDVIDDHKNIREIVLVFYDAFMIDDDDDDAGEEEVATIVRGFTQRVLHGRV